MKKTSIGFLAIVLALSVAVRAHAWNDTGHQVIGLMAYQALDDGTKKKVLEILKFHPHYDAYLARNIPAGADAGEWIAMHSASWPDWVRSGPPERRKYHHGTWHYINKPFIVVDADDTETAAEIKAQFNDPTRDHGKILWVIPECQKIVKATPSTDEERVERAVRLCWLFHLVGDLHQPLHAVALCNKQMPGGDHGGNMAYITRESDSIPRKLHVLWDHMLGNFATYDALQGLARFIQHKATTSEDEQKVTNPDSWAEESLDLAKTNVYTFQGKPIDMSFDPEGDGPSDAPKLPDGYETAAAQIARKRALLASQRLAALLKSTLAN